MSCDVKEVQWSDKLELIWKMRLKQSCHDAIDAKIKDESSRSFTSFFHLLLQVHRVVSEDIALYHTSTLHIT